MTQLPTHIEEISLPDLYEPTNSTLVCRTCTHRDNHLWFIPKMDLLKRMTQGENKETIECAPNKTHATVRVLETIRSKGRLVPIGVKASQPTRAVVDTCGHSIRPECKGCDRFAPIQTRVPYSKSINPQTGKPFKVFWAKEMRNGKEISVAKAEDGSTVFWWKVMIGGHCTLPVDGIVKKGVRVYCDPMPRKLAIEEPSCDNCHWLDQGGENWQSDYLTINENATLTPWEREMAYSLMDEEIGYPQAIGIMTKRKQQYGFCWTGSNPALNRANGRSMWYRATVVKEAWHEGMYKFRLKFDESQTTAVIADDDDRWTVHRTDDPEIIGLEIRWPYQKIFGLPDRLMKYNLRWPKLPEPTLVQEVNPLLADPNCPRCGPAKPCYYHAKAPKKSDVTGEIIFQRPWGVKSEWVYPAHGLMDVTERQGEIVAIDGNGNLPVTYEPKDEKVANVAVFRLWRPTLVARAYRKWGERGAQAIEAQYHELWRMLHRAGRGTPTRPTWYVNSGLEPSKPRCSHPLGLNLRKVFADSFGSERTDWDFDTGAQTTMAVDEEIRVGFRQHGLTPQRLHEEVLSNDCSNPNFDPKSNSVIHPKVDWPETMVTIKLKGVGGMTSEDGTPVEDTSEFLDRLDEEVIVGTLGEDGHPRFMSKRMQMFGYDMTRGYYGKRTGGDKTAMPSRDRDVVIFGDDENSDQDDVIEDWRCVDCGNTYTQDQIKDYFYPVCEECGSDLYKIHNTREVHNPRAGGGVGNALVMDTENMRQRKRLQATLCPNWKLKGSTDIYLEQTAGPTLHAASVRAAFAIEEETVKVIKVKQASLTPDQERHNEAYWVLNESVTQARSEHLEAYPDTTPAELIAKFPRPKGEVYQIQAAGSLAKMGSV